jgi:hypothetical protein
MGNRAGFFVYGIYSATMSIQAKFKRKIATINKKLDIFTFPVNNTNYPSNIQ